MKLVDSLQLSLSGLRGNVTRTFLTILGLAIGVAAILTVLTLGNAGETRVEAEIAKLGVNKVWISAVTSRYRLQPSDASKLYAYTKAPACAGIYTAANVIINGETAYAQIAGFDENMERVHKPDLMNGRLFHHDDFDNGRGVCLIDEAMAERFDLPLIGKYLAVNNRRFRIVGIIKGLSMNVMSGWNGMVILPMKTCKDTFDSDIAEITLLIPAGQSASELAEQSLNLLSHKEGYRAVTLENEINAAREIVRIFVMVLASVAIVCMLTGGIGVMNVLLISVRERRSEIGLIKAIGGSEKQVCFLFLLEAVIYALLGSLMGLILGVLMISCIGNWIGLSARLQMMTVIPVLLSAAGLGLIAGVMPAVKASRMQPVDALHND